MKPPIMDAANREELLNRLLSRLSGYTPEWRPQPGKSGYALLSLFTRYGEILLQGLNSVPERNRLAYLEMLGNSRMPAQSARAPLTFKLMDNNLLDVMLQSRTQVAARQVQPPPSLLEGQTDPTPESPVLFFTEQTITLSRGQLVVLYSIDPDSDSYANHSERINHGFNLFDSLQPVPHVLYLGQNELFRLAGNAEITLSFDFGATGPVVNRRPLLLDWEYLSKDGWLPLKIDRDDTMRFTQDGKITLRKDCGPDSKEEEIKGYPSYWIRGQVSSHRPFGKIITAQAAGPNFSFDLEDAREFLIGDLVTVDGVSDATIRNIANATLFLDKPLPEVSPGNRLILSDDFPPLRPEGADSAGALPAVDIIRARVGFSKSGLAPEKAFINTAPLDTTNRFYPFGLQPVAFATFYLGSEEVFKRRGASIVILVELAQPGKINKSPLQLAFEYFDGEDWSGLDSGSYEFIDATQSFTVNKQSIRFLCPENWQKTKINGADNYWLRIRIDTGDYGHPLRVKVVPDGGGYKVESEPDNLTPPVIAKLSLSYTYSTMPTLLDHCLAYNDFAFTDHSDDCRWPNRPFLPFVPIGDREAAVHFAFTHKLPAGLISLFVAVSHSAESGFGASPYVWEYRVEGGWKELVVLDETKGFQRSGLIQFVGPYDAVPTLGLGEMQYRIRARIKAGLRWRSQPLEGLWLNTVWGRQGENIQSDLIGISDGSPDQTLHFPELRVPVLVGESIEVREWNGRGDSWETAVQGVAAENMRFERDPVSSEPLAVWVRWMERSHLYRSGPNDRHYLLERATGRLVFGDQKYGMIPPAGSRILASYATGGGLKGNVAVGDINELRTGIGYVEKVSNPLPALGGTASESLFLAGKRSQQRLRHRLRAVSAADYEWLALEATPEVARVRCISLLGTDGKPMPGRLSLVLVPWSTEYRPEPSVELMGRVRLYLEERLPAGLSRNIRLMGPKYTKASVSADVIPTHAEEAALVEARIRERLQRYLHPLTGGEDGRGWEFSQSLYLSSIASLIETTAGVDCTTWLRLKSDDAFVSEAVMPAPDSLLAPGDFQLNLIVGGH